MRKVPGPCTVHKCRQCGSNARVVETRATLKAYIRRRMRCNRATCNERWSTFEIREDDYIALVKARNQLAGVMEITGTPLRDGLTTKNHRGYVVLESSGAPANGDLRKQTS